jgi:hypothetical protein
MALAAPGFSADFTVSVADADLVGIAHRLESINAARVADVWDHDADAQTPMVPRQAPMTAAEWVQDMVSNLAKQAIAELDMQLGALVDRVKRLSDTGRTELLGVVEQDSAAMKARLEALTTGGR